MYIHLGDSQVIPIKDIIVMVNITTPLQQDLATVLERARKENKLTVISDKGKEKAMVICTDKVYISPISSNTLYKRGKIAAIMNRAI